MLSDKWRDEEDNSPTYHSRINNGWVCADQLEDVKASALQNFDSIERAYRLENGLGVAYKDSYLEMIGKLRKELESI